MKIKCFFLKIGRDCRMEGYYKREELKDMNKFILFGLTHWTLEWYNGVDFAPNFLYEQGKKVA